MSREDFNTLDDLFMDVSFPALGVAVSDLADAGENRDLVKAAYVVRGELTEQQAADGDLSGMHRGEARVDHWQGRLENGLGADELLGQMLYEAAQGSTGLNQNDDVIEFRESTAQSLLELAGEEGASADALLDRSGELHAEYASLLEDRAGFTLQEVTPSVEKTFLWEDVDTSAIREFLKHAAEYQESISRDGDAEEVWDGAHIDQFGEEYVGAVYNWINEYPELVDEQVEFNPAVLTPREYNDGVVEAGYTSDLNNQIEAGTSYALHGAYIDGGGGHNTVAVDMKGPFAQPQQLRNIQEVQVQNQENVYESEFFDWNNSARTEGDSAGFEQLLDAGANSDDSILDLNRAGSLEQLVVTESSVGNGAGELQVLGIRGDAAAHLEGGFSNDVTLHYGSGIDSAVELELGGVQFDHDGDGASLNLAHNVGAVDLTSSGRINTLDGMDFGKNFRELIVEGSGELVLEDDLGFAFGEASVDASENTGGVRLSLDAVGDEPLNHVEFSGSQGDDVVYLPGVERGAHLDIDTGAGSDRVVLGDAQFEEDGVFAGGAVDAGDGSVLTGEDLTVEVDVARLTKADVSGVDRFVLNANVPPALTLNFDQVAELGAEAFEAAHDSVVGLGVQIDENRDLSELMDLDALDENVELYLEVTDSDAELTMTAEQLHEYVAEAGINAEMAGSLVINDADEGFSVDEQSGHGTGGTVEGYQAGADQDVTINRAPEGFERPEPEGNVDELVIDTDQLQDNIAANDIDSDQAFSTSAQTVMIEGNSNLTFDAPVEMLEDNFTIDASGHTGELDGLHLTNFHRITESGQVEDQGEIIGNPDQDTRIDVDLSGGNDVGEPGNENGLKSSGVETYVAHIDDVANSFYVCDRTEGVEQLGLQGTGEISFEQVNWGTGLLLEGDGGADWDDLSKSEDDPNTSNVGSVAVTFFLPGASATVEINNQGTALGQASDGSDRPLEVESITLDNVAEAQLNIADGDALINGIDGTYRDGATSDDGEEDGGLSSITLDSANDVTLHMDGSLTTENSGTLEELDASAVAGEMWLVVDENEHVDLSDVDLTGVDTLYLEEGATLELTDEQLDELDLEITYTSVGTPKSIDSSPLNAYGEGAKSTFEFIANANVVAEDEEDQINIVDFEAGEDGDILDFSAFLGDGYDVEGTGDDPVSDVDETDIVGSVAFWDGSNLGTGDFGDNNSFEQVEGEAVVIGNDGDIWYVESGEDDVEDGDIQLVGTVGTDFDDLVEENVGA